MESPSTLSGMCRCCAAEGTFKDIKRSYQWMGEEEVYGDMIRECFDVKLITSEFGGICEMCITHLRNAFNFKKQVLDTEQQFKRHLEAGKFKSPVVKEELSADEDMNDSEDNDMDNIDDEDYVPEFEVPIKTEDLLDEPLKSKKRSAKPTTSRAKKSKSTGIEIKSIQSAENLTKQGKIVSELDKQRHNIRQILLCSNATPVHKRADTGYACCFCNAHFVDPALLKKHTIQDHDRGTKLHFMQISYIHTFNVKLDVTDLECRLCTNKISSIAELYRHLTEVHKKAMFLNLQKLIMPIKFSGQSLLCAVCDDSSSKTLKTLQVHMNTHFRNYVCNVCNVGFVNYAMLKTHKKSVHSSNVQCSFCSSTFDNNSKRAYHEVSVHTKKGLLRHKCGHCNKRFKSGLHKLKHIAAEHNIPIPTHDCKACDQKFFKPHLLKLHVKKVHLMEKHHECPNCDMAFYHLASLREHLVKHTKVKEFVCVVCHKQFARKKSVAEHMKIHTNDKRFKCMICDQAFVQKCSMKRHMVMKH